MDGNLGQDLDYRAVALLLGFMPDAAVVDVGAERGGFTRLCLEHGARRVDAFEPLDRHWRHLHGAFSGEPRVHLHRQAVSDTSGTARLRVAVDARGHELDHHHSLSAVEGSSSFSIGREETVETITIGEACARMGLPTSPAILKLDTEGHDLQALAGLGECRPGIIICEFWMDLPETSGHCPYRLADLAGLAARLGYRDLLCIRHRGDLDWVDWNNHDERPGEWGNAFFCAPATWAMVRDHLLPGLASDGIRRMADRIDDLRRQLVEKEAVITGLATAAQERLDLIHRLSQPNANGQT